MKSMLTITCTCLCLFFCSSLQAQPLFTYGPATVDKAEFLRAFLKNNSQQQPGEKDFRDYLELFARYRLKVQAAYDMHLDTLAGQKTEAREFRRQLSESFLFDEGSLKTLVTEAFNRSRKDIRLTHIFIPLGTAGVAADTVKAYRLAMEAYQELQNGTDFGKVANRYSADTSARANKGDLGYITVFTLPYALENIAYSTPAGTCSRPYRSNAGYHIFKNVEERQAAGRMKIAQILFAFPPEADDKAKAGIKRLADSVYNALLHGASFTAMVTQYSNDNLTSSAGGELPELGVGQFDAAFESLVFALPENGAISKPALTSDGCHIIKRIAHYPVNTDPANEDAMALLRRQVMADARIEGPKQAMLQKMYAATATRKAAVKEADLHAYADSLVKGRQLPKRTSFTENTVLLSSPKQQVSAGEWIAYLKRVKDNAEVTSGKMTPALLLKEYEDIRVKQYYIAHLEEYSPEFAAQLQEFRDGNLLFEVMQRNVWDKAAADSAGLKKYFAANAAKYNWKASADAIIFSCKDAATAATLKEKLAKNARGWQAVITPYESSVQADSGRFELAQIPAQGNPALKAGMVTTPVAADPANADNGFSFACIVRIHPQGEPRSFDDARGYVLNDYQNYMEEQWMASLKKKYPVTVNERVLTSLWQPGGH